MASSIKASATSTAFPQNRQLSARSKTALICVHVGALLKGHCSIDLDRKHRRVVSLVCSSCDHPVMAFWTCHTISLAQAVCGVQVRHNSLHRKPFHPLCVYRAITGVGSAGAALFPSASFNHLITSEES